MAGHLRIEIADEVLRSLAQGGAITAHVGSHAPQSRPRSAALTQTGERTVYRGGSLPERLHSWASERGSAFRTDDVVDALGVSRAHASMLLNKVINDAGPIQRVARGVYAMEGVTRNPPKAAGNKRAKAKKPSKKK